MAKRSLAALADDVEIIVLQRLVDDADCRAVHLGVRGQEEVADRKLAEFQTVFPGNLGKELWRQIHANSSTIACAIRAHSAPVRDRTERFMYFLDDVVRKRTRLPRNEAHSTAGMVLRKVEQTNCVRTCLLSLQIRSPFDYGALRTPKGHHVSTQRPRIMSALLTYLSFFSTGEPDVARLTGMRKINVPQKCG